MQRVGRWTPIESTSSLTMKKKKNDEMRLDIIKRKN
jgi:hypothetical protein